MNSVTLSAPAMFADHHVLKAREALLALDGIDDVYASSAWQSVIVSYDAAKIEPAAIEKALAEAGYAPDKELPILAQNDQYHIGKDAFVQRVANDPLINVTKKLEYANRYLEDPIDLAGVQVLTDDWAPVNIMLNPLSGAPFSVAGV